MADSLTFVVVTDGVWQERHRFDAQAMARAVRPVPEWIARRPHEGGAGGFIGPGATDRAAIYRKVVRQGYIDRQVAIDAETVLETNVAVAQHMGSGSPSSRARVTRQMSQQACNRVRDMMRLVRLCPPSQLGDLYDLLVVEHERLRRLAMLAIGVHTGALAVGAEAAKLACWNRLVNEDEQPARAKVRSERGTLGRTGLSDDNLFQCSECDRLSREAH